MKPFEIHRVLAGVDGSARARGVFSAASALAQRFGAELFVVRVVSVPPDFPPAAATAAPDPLPDFLKTKAQIELEHVVETDPGAQPAQMLVAVHAQPWRGLLETAKQVGADVIVIGSHGYGGLDRLLGTTAGQVANQAHCHVMIVHER